MSIEDTVSELEDQHILTLLASTLRAQGRPESLFYSSHTNSALEALAPFQIRQKHSIESSPARLTKESALKSTYSTQSCYPPQGSQRAFTNLENLPW